MAQVGKGKHFKPHSMRIIGQHFSIDLKLIVDLSPLHILAI